MSYYVASGHLRVLRETATWVLSACVGSHFLSLLFLIVSCLFSSLSFLVFVHDSFSPPRLLQDTTCTTLTDLDLPRMDQFPQQPPMNEDQNYVPQSYSAYASDEDHGSYSMPYQQPPGIVNYPVHQGGQPRGFHPVSCTSAYCT